MKRAMSMSIIGEVRLVRKVLCKLIASEGAFSLSKAFAGELWCRRLVGMGLYIGGQDSTQCVSQPCMSVDKIKMKNLNLMKLQEGDPETTLGARIDRLLKV